jgi:hypothetical protein
MCLTPPRAQLLPSGALSAAPTASVTTDAYHFCRFAVAPAQAALAGGGACRPVALAGGEPAHLELWDLESGSRVASFAPPAAPDAHAAGSAPRSGMLLAVRAAVHEGTLYLLGGYEDGWCARWPARARAGPTCH